MTTESQNWIKVHINFELPMDVPYADDKGTLAFRTTDVAPKGGLTVKVPESATETKDALMKYLEDCYYGREWVAPTNANIWVEDKDREDGGYFKF